MLLRGTPTLLAKSGGVQGKVRRRQRCLHQGRSGPSPAGFPGNANSHTNWEADCVLSPKNGCNMEATPPPTIITSGSSKSTMLPSHTVRSVAVSSKISLASNRQ